ncbi:MAG: DUF4270 family protein [Bacteroidales bacterium]|nr:DUF4270 family protein [Bacteroidales bacterium]
MKLSRLFSILAIVALILFVATSCSDEESSIGDSLQDPSTLYNGTFDTIKGSDLYVATLHEDSLLTSSQLTAMVGRTQDDVFGGVTAQVYTQVATSTGNGIDFSDVSDGAYIIDSVTLSLFVGDVYGDTLNVKSLHFLVHQLAEPLTDSFYYAIDSKPVTTLFADTVISCVFKPYNTLRLKLNDQFGALMKQRYGSAEQFTEAIKGLRISVTDDSDPLMLTLGFSNSNTMLKVHYTHETATTTRDSVNFILGYNSSTATTQHFTSFVHDYSGTALADFSSSDSLLDRTTLYLQPMGGTYVYVCFDGWVRRFHAQHPNAVINYAELLLPLSDKAPASKPEQLMLYKRFTYSGHLLSTTINDASSTYTYRGFDGTCHDDAYYRVRVPLHLQERLRQGSDLGMLINIYNRTATARSTVLNGPEAAEPMQIVIVYSE